MKNLIRTVCSFFLLVALVQPGNVSAGDDEIEVSITNLSATVVLTPPIVAASKDQVTVFQLTEPASVALEMLAEGGNTDALATMFEEHKATVVQATEAILPGHTLTLTVSGKKNSRISLAAMILPTNDGFVAMNSVKIKRRETITYLSAYDAGTEVNDELCDNIPGPMCGGEGYNMDRPSLDEGFVYPHPGTHGEGDISVAAFSWAEPVVMVTTRRIK